MNSLAVIPLIATIAYIPLFVGLISSRPWQKRHWLFLCFLIPAVLWSLITFLSMSGWFTENKELDVSIVICIAMWVLVQFHYFVRSFYQAERIKIPWAYLFPIATIALLVSPVSELVKFTVTGSAVRYGGGIVAIFLLFLCTVGFKDTWSLLKKDGLSPEPAERNRIRYLLAAIGIFTVFLAFQVLLQVPVLSRIAPRQLAEFPIIPVGNFFVAWILTDAVVKHRLGDINVVFRRALVKAVLYGGGIGIPSLLLLHFYDFDKHSIDLGPLMTIIVLYITAIVLLSVHKVRDLLQRKVEEFFVGARSLYRRQLSEFITGMHNVSTLEQLGKRFLPLLAQSVDCRRACLLLPEAGEGGFSAQFTYPPVEDNPMRELKLRRDNPIVAWLEREGAILQERRLAILTEFQSMWAEERTEIQSAAAEMFVPILNEGKLVAIAAVSDKRDGKAYAVEDIDLLRFITAQVAASMEKEYSRERERQESRTDELTGLFNRRHFAERLKEELDRHSRYNDVFSIFMIDLDKFKAHNDAYGHLAGDILLGHIGKIIKNSVRSVDQAFRYGGDEFVVILPETGRDDAYNVAERVQKQIAREMRKKEIAVTCSIGLASCPVDGVVDDELIHVADSALYNAKRAGGSRIFPPLRDFV